MKSYRIMGLAVTVLCLLAHECCVGQAIVAGSGRIGVDIDGTVLDVFTHKPGTYDGKRMIMVLHGTLRNADEYRDHAVAMGTRFGALIVAPRFDRKRFPSRRYHRGGIVRRDGTAAPPTEWTYPMIPKLAADIRRREGKPKLPYWIIGHSAGGQFVARMSAFQDTGAERHVAANPGSELFPDRTMKFGYGFGGLPEDLSDDAALQRYLAAPLTLYLGTDDDAPDDYFDRSETAMKQGGGRLQRGVACHAAAIALAKEKGWTCNWRVVKAPGVGHDHEKMFDHPSCRVALFGEDSRAETLARFGARLEADVANDGIGSIAAAVFAGGDVLWSEAYGFADRAKKTPATRKSIYRTGSISKSFTAVVLAKLAEEKVVALDDPVAKHLPEIAGLLDAPEGAKPITLRQLASHTAGLIREPRLAGAASGPIADWEKKILASIPKTSFRFEPGERYSYSNIGFGILGLALSRAAKTPFIELVESRILEPLGMKSSTFIIGDDLRPRLAAGYANGRRGIDAEQPASEHAGRGYKVPNGGLYSTTGDLARFAAGMLGLGEKAVLSQATREEVFRLQTPGDTDRGYGLGFTLRRDEKGRRLAGHGGSVAGYNAHLVFDLDRKIGVVLLRNYNRGSTNLGRAAGRLLTEL